MAYLESSEQPMKKFERFVFSKDDIGFYLLPLVGFSWGKAYGKNIWFGWLRWCIRINLI